MTKDNIIMVDPLETSFMDLETFLNATNTVRVGYMVLEMFAEYDNYDIYIGAINPKYADAFIKEFERINDCQVWFNTMTYWL